MLHNMDGIVLFITCLQFSGNLTTGIIKLSYLSCTECSCNTMTCFCLPRFQLCLLCLNSASYSLWDGNRIVAYRLWGRSLLWLIGALVCLLAANCRSNCSLMQATDSRIVRCGIMTSCQSAATFDIVKALLAMSLSRVRSAIASTGLYFTLLSVYVYLCLCRQSSDCGTKPG